MGLDVTGGGQCRGSGEGSYREAGTLARRVGSKLIDVVSASELQNREDQREEQKDGESRLDQRRAAFCSLQAHLATQIANTVPHAAATPNGVRTMERLLTLICGCALKPKL